MIAAAGTAKLAKGEQDGLDLDADITLRLQNVEVRDDGGHREKVRYKT